VIAELPNDPRWVLYTFLSGPAGPGRFPSLLVQPPRKLGNASGVVRLTRNMFRARVVLSAMEPPSPGPHERLCFPKEICQFDHISPT